MGITTKRFSFPCASALSCLILCDPMDCSPPGSSVPGILQARILEWVAMPSSRESSQPRDQTQVSRTAGRFFTVWATREALSFPMDYDKWRAETQPLIAAYHHRGEQTPLVSWIQGRSPGTQFPNIRHPQNWGEAGTTTPSGNAREQCTAGKNRYTTGKKKKKNEKYQVGLRTSN